MRMRFVRVSSVRVRFVCMFILRMRMRVGGSISRRVRNDYVNLGASDASAGDPAHIQARADVQCGDGFLEMGEGDSGVNQSAEEHVAANSGEAIQIANTHRK